MVELKPLAGTDFYLWHYLPSVPLSAAAGSLFLAVTVIHVFRTVRSGTRFNYIFAVGGTFQVIGYGVRVLAHYYTNLLAPYLIQSCFIILAPIFYAASIYICLSRIVKSSGGDGLSLFRPRMITRIFLAGDFSALNIQGNGAGLVANHNPTVAKIGQIIVIVGLFFQLGIFIFFVIVAAIWQRRMSMEVQRRKATETGEGQRETSELPPWRQGVYVLYACSALIGVRSVFRVVEYIQGQGGYLLTTEWPLYAFDTLPMLATQAVYVIWFPSQFKIENGDRRKGWMRLLKRNSRTTAAGS